MKSIRTLSTNKTFKDLSNMLYSEKRLFFSRFGDVDFLMMKKERVGDILGRSNKTGLQQKSAVQQTAILEAF